MNECSFRWLHITDLHMGKTNDAQAVAFNSMVRCIQSKYGTLNFDAVFLTGDIAYSGLPEEYEIVESRLVAPLRRLSCCESATFVAVPGNHDLDCSVDIPPSWENIGRDRQEKFFYCGDVGRRTRGSRPNAFASFSEFCKRCGVLFVDPTMEPIARIKLERFPNISILCVVTAYFSDKEVRDYGKAPAPLVALRSAQMDSPGESVLLILGHHPPTWFTAESKAQLHSYLVTESAVYLHGHEHAVQSDFGSRGLVSLGFGAAYQAPQELQVASYYRNSFAVCEIRDALHVSVCSWESQHDVWRPDQQLPGDFYERSDKLVDGYVLAIPSTRLAASNRSQMTTSGAMRSGAAITDFIWLADDSPERWTQTLRDLKVLRDPSDVSSPAHVALPVGHRQFRVKDASGLTLVRAISASGDILHQDVVHFFNSELDSLDYNGGLIVTVGILGTGARTLASRLSARKSIKIFERSDLLRMFVSSLPGAIERALASMKLPETVEAKVVFSDDGLCLLLSEPSPRDSFIVLDNTGALLPEASPLVRKLRTIVFSDSPSSVYGFGVASETLNSPLMFDREAYLSACRDYFDDVRYAPLAALGFRFRSASLSDMYVEPSAHVGGTSKRSLAMASAVAELVDSLDLSNDQRDEIEVQLRSRHGITASAEVGAARKLYQRYNNVLVLGDPGSGKTCFIKHEILSYCAPDFDGSDWYSRHLPIYVSLAEVASLSPPKSLLDACVALSARRGIDLPREEVDRALVNGAAAFFFDGLDEVSHIDIRIGLISEIDQLMREYAKRGCRFVLSSRPAAVQPVDIPNDFTRLQLSGLTDDEIRILAGKVIANRVGSESDKLAESELEIVERLLADAKARPGLSRLARNPLLLTLLVLIYANSGALSARRHVVYTQAIKTLVSIRAKETRKHQISEADLRARLGRVALAILRREIAEIPRREEVVGVMAPLMTATSTGQQMSEANAYLQEVAEATGLVSLHSGDESGGPEHVTFMHYSFLEYYAAAGMLNESYLVEIPKTLGSSRWQDVTTLLVGLLSEQSDVTPLVERILASGDSWDHVTGSPLLLALDCLAECDVPPQASQRAIADAIENALASGAGLRVPEFREEIASRLGGLLEACGRQMIAVLLRGFSSPKQAVREAYIDLVGRIDVQYPLPPPVVEALETCISQGDASVRVAGLNAVRHRADLRRATAVGLVKSALRASVAEKRAALKLLADTPSMVAAVLKELQEVTREADPSLARLAAQALLPEILRNRESSNERSAMVKGALRALESGFVDDEKDFVANLAVERVHVEEMLGSTEESVRVLGLRYLPGVRNDPHWVYRQLSGGLKSGSSPKIVAASLDALRLSSAAISLITIGDTDVICRLVGHPNRNVRVAALKLLGAMPDDQSVISALQRRLLSGTAYEYAEIVEAAKSLAQHVQRNQKLSEDSLGKMMALLSECTRNGFGNAAAQSTIEALLLVCESIGGSADDKDAWRLHDLALLHSTPLSIRKRALRVFGRVVRPSARAIDAVIVLLRSCDPRVRYSVYTCALSFVVHCKQRVDYVRLVLDRLTIFRECLVAAWRKEESEAGDTALSFDLSTIREAVLEVSELMASYNEFAARASVRGVSSRIEEAEAIHVRDEASI